MTGEQGLFETEFIANRQHLLGITGRGVDVAMVAVTITCEVDCRDVILFDQVRRDPIPPVRVGGMTMNQQNARFAVW